MKLFQKVSITLMTRIDYGEFGKIWCRFTDYIYDYKYNYCGRFFSGGSNNIKLKVAYKI